MKIAVCDDTAADLEQASEYILQYADQLALDFEIEKFGTGEDLLCAFQKSAYPVVFLDILMDGMSGVETACKIRKMDSSCALIFTTASPDFRADGFEVGAVHYLLKPLTYRGVKSALDRCERLFAESEKKFSITANRQTVWVRFKDVLYLEVYGKCTLIHTLSGMIKTYTPLFKVASLLQSGPFLMCHRCYVVNMSYISGILEDRFELDNKETIPIRRKGRQAVKDEYCRYFLNTVRRHGDE